MKLPRPSREPESTLDEIVERMSQELQWLRPPEDVHDAAAWDKYWDDQIAHGLNLELLSDLFTHDQHLVNVMVNRGFNTILCVGSGASAEPRVLADAGFRVTALDLSAIALSRAQAIQRHPDDWQRFFDRPMHRPGGSLTHIVGDLFDATVCCGPFDVIIERRTVQLCGDELPAAMEALAHRLSPVGILLSHSHAGWWRPGEPLVHPAQSWLESRGWTIWSDRSDAPPPGRLGWLSMSTG